jgi:hypothetical protein
MIEDGIRSLILSDPTLSGLVKHIYPVYVPEDAAYPCLSYQVVSGSADFTLDFAGVWTKLIQFDAWARTYDECKQIEAALASLLDGYEGTLSNGVRVLMSLPGVVIDKWEQDTAIFRVMAEYQFEFTK